jgi:hypothetical protein
MISTTNDRPRRAPAPARFGRRTLVAVVVAGVLAAACDVHKLSAPGALARIVVSPNATLVAATTQQMIALGFDAEGRPVSIAPTWSVAANGGTISSSGVFSAGLVAGSFANTVVATVGSISGRASITVTPGALASIALTPSPVTLAVTTTQQFVAVGKDAGGNIVPFSPTWSIVAGGGTINQAGMFTANGTVGTYGRTVQVGNNGVVAFATVTLTSTTPPVAIADLGAASPNGIMAGTAVTCVTGGIINADASVSPGNTVTGFGPCVITDVQHLGDAVAAQAQIDLTTAYNKLAALPCSPSNAITGNLGGTTKPAGVYCTASGIGVTGTLTLDGGGDPNATFVFQAGSSLITAGNVILINGAQARNVYWQVGSSATIGTSSQWQGNILALTSITLVDDATLLGRALARNGAVSLGTNNIITLP